jgi:hypothetical protein
MNDAGNTQLLPTSQNKTLSEHFTHIHHSKLFHSINMQACNIHIYYGAQHCKLLAITDLWRVRFQYSLRDVCLLVRSVGATVRHSSAAMETNTRLYHTSHSRIKYITRSSGKNKSRAVIWVADTSTNKTLVRMRNEVIKQYNLRGRNVGITDGRDLWGTPLRWPQLAWYSYQVS